MDLDAIPWFNSLYSKYKTGAARRGLDFSLTKIEFYNLTKSNCYICNAEPHRSYRNNDTKCMTPSYVHNGVDRVDPSIGYIISNCRACCKTCNYLKNTLTIDEFKNHILKIFSSLVGKI